MTNKLTVRKLLCAISCACLFLSTTAAYALDTDTQKQKVEQSCIQDSAEKPTPKKQTEDTSQSAKQSPAKLTQKPGGEKGPDCS